MLGPPEIQRNLTPGLQFQTLCLCKQLLQILGTLTRRLKKRDGMAGSGHPRRASVGTGSRVEGRKQGQVDNDVRPARLQGFRDSGRAGGWQG